MKKHLLTLMLCLGLGVFASQAITVDDLDGKIGGIIYGSNFAQGNLSHISDNDFDNENYHFQNFRHYGVKFEKISDTRVRIVNMWEGFDVCATLNSSGQLTLDATNYGKDDMSGNTLNITPTAWRGFTISDYMDFNFDGYMHWYKLLDGSVQSAAYKQLSSLKNVGVFQFSNTETAYRIPNLGAAGNYCFTTMQLFVFEANATAYRLNASNEIIDSFGVRVTPNSSNTSMEILNWNNYGLNYQNQATNNSNGYINVFTTAPTYNQIECAISGNTLSIPFQKEAGLTGGISKDYGRFYVSALFDQHANYYNKGYGTGIWFQENTNLWNANSFISGSTDQTAITGSIKPDVSHVFDDVKWTAQDGGKLLTYDTPVYEFGPSKVMFFSATKFLNIEYSDQVNKTIIIPNGTQDVTHSATLEIGNGSDDFVYTYFKKGNEWKKELKLNATITNRTNSQYVDSYDLYVVPQNVGSVDTWSTSDHHATKGHAQGVCIAQGIKGAVSRSSDGDVPVAVHLTGDAVPALNATGNNTLYLKANYTPESGLAPTFHSLISSPITTGVETVDMGDENVKVIVKGNELAVSGAQHVEIYTLSGTEVYAGGEGVITVGTGIYVVKAGDVVKKVIVK